MPTGINRPVPPPTFHLKLVATGGSSIEFRILNESGQSIAEGVVGGRYAEMELPSGRYRIVKNEQGVDIPWGDLDLEMDRTIYL
ncbi:hypothetical protein GCM10010353_73020 [Streptomyces chryseus]|nr:hypothetical protein GCM10010353_73020 [Streptomyces chryseus]